MLALQKAVAQLQTLNAERSSSSAAGADLHTSGTEHEALPDDGGEVKVVEDDLQSEYGELPATRAML